MERMWYYMHENSQKGPVSQAELTNLIQQGVIQGETYVWTEGMADWQPAASMNLSAQIPSMGRLRPTVVTVFAVLNIVFGGLGLLCSPIGIAGMLIEQPGMPVYSGATLVFAMFSTGLGMIMSGVLLAAGIGLLNQKRWARQTSYFYGWFAIVWGIISIVITLVAMISEAPAVNGEAATAGIIGAISGACGGLIGLIYPIFLVIYMRKTTIIEACHR